MVKLSKHTNFTFVARALLNCRHFRNHPLPLTPAQKFPCENRFYFREIAVVGERMTNNMKRQTFLAFLAQKKKFQ